jgi:hypothetical protein
MLLTLIYKLFKISCSVFGGVPERLKGSDCKSDGFAFVGSNPTPSTNRCGGVGEWTKKVRVWVVQAGVVQW